ncbi:MAG: hypothetical protein AB7O29_06315, partial [Acidimicrobiia bacterium]
VRSEADRALRLAGPGTVFDAVELHDDAGADRLRRYAEGSVPGPIAGFWTAADLAAATAASHPAGPVDR